MECRGGWLIVYVKGIALNQANCYRPITDFDENLISLLRLYCHLDSLLQQHHPSPNSGQALLELLYTSIAKLALHIPEGRGNPDSSLQIQFARCHSNYMQQYYIYSLSSLPISSSICELNP